MLSLPPEVVGVARTKLLRNSSRPDVARRKRCGVFEALRGCLPNDWRPESTCVSCTIRDRRLFTVGYTVGGPVQFTSHYDLLASECRLASLVAIAKGDVPQEHWFALARPRVVAPHGRQALLSWSGTMFEYLMPLMFMRSLRQFPAGSRMPRSGPPANRIRRGQTACPGESRNPPISALDANQIYQYRAFGVPALALKPRASTRIWSIAPYATMLALLVDPAAAIANLRQSGDSSGLPAPWDFTNRSISAARTQEDGEPGVPVYAYMAHHQGMSLMALDDMLHRDMMRQRFHGDVRVRAVESLLFERIPITRPPPRRISRAPRPVRLARRGTDRSAPGRKTR